MDTTVTALVDHYRTVHAERMHGLPIVNPALEVAAIGFREFDSHELGVLLTPWFMNLVLLPRSAEWYGVAQGEEVELEMPSGPVAFTTCDDERLGLYLSAILFRTVTDFPDQATALDVGRAVMEELFTPPKVPPSKPQRTLSRRELFNQVGGT